MMDLKRIYTKVFLWMFLGLLMTFVTGYIVSVNENMLEAIFRNNLWILFSIIEIVLVIILSARIRKMSTTTARILFLVYSFITGLTFSSIFVTYNLDSIIYVFAITALLFGVFALIGHFTKLDLSKLSTYLFMALLGIIICTIINMFLGNDTFTLVITIISVIVFLGYTAYDVRKIRLLQNSFDNEDNLVICGALELYLDFINLFIDLLRLFASRKD